MHDVTWLIDADLFDYYRDELVRQIEQAGFVPNVLPLLPWGYDWGSAADLAPDVPPGACLVAYGSLQIARLVSEESLWIPGVFGPLDRFDCSTYYAHFGKHLLNAKYCMLPLAEFERCAGFLFDTFGVDDTVFVRPNSCQKLFTGQLVRRGSVIGDMEIVRFYDPPPNALIVVGSPQPIVREWRFVVADKAVVAGSKYNERGEIIMETVDRGTEWDYAQSIAKGDFQPARVWILDICETTNSQRHLLEIGCFSYSELYRCNLEPVVREVSRIALDEWEMHRKK